MRFFIIIAVLIVLSVLFLVIFSKEAAAPEDYGNGSEEAADFIGPVGEPFVEGPIGPPPSAEDF